MNGIRLAIIASARGAGKTFAIAVYIIWRIYTHENWSISSMGGAQIQTNKIATIIRGWFIDNPIIQKYTMKIIKEEIITYSNSSAQFYACFTGDTIIYGDNKPIQETSTETIIIDGDGEETNPSQVMKRKYSGKILIIKPRGLLPITVTPEHPILVCKYKKHYIWVHINNHPHHGINKWNVEKSPNEWKTANELTNDDYVLVPRKKTFNEFDNEELSWLLGIYLAEGWIEKRYNKRRNKYYNSVFFSFGFHETELIKKTIYLLQKYFKSGTISGYKNTAEKIVISKIEAVRFFKSCGFNSNDKHIPKFILKSNPKISKIFIQGYMDGDGDAQKRSFRLTTTTKQIVYDIIELFTMNLGILPSVYITPAHQGVICGRKVNCKKSYSIMINRNIWLNDKNKYNHWFRDINYIYVPITNITSKNVKNIDVFNMSIPNTETYCVPFVVHNCSETATRGAHVNDLIIDEQASGEAKGGERFIRAALFQISTSPDIHIIQSSTIHYHGDFVRTWNNAEKLGYKRYSWTLAKHISGEKDIYKNYQDMNPDHWSTAVPWGNDRNIKVLRKNAGNDEWLVECLGGISISSGLVFNPADLNVAICKAACDECQPYKNGVCLEFVQRVLMMEGIPFEELPTNTEDAVSEYIHNRVLGIDWGRGSPTAFTVLGQYKNWVFVLEAHETIGLTDQEKLDLAVELCNKWQVEVARPDPREWTLNGWLAERIQASVHELFTGAEGGNEKYKYVATLKKYVERHKLCIPNHQSNDDLIRSLRNASYDEDGKIEKKDDHSFDSMIYAISYYDEVMGEGEDGSANEVRGGVNLW